MQSVNAVVGQVSSGQQEVRELTLEGDFDRKVPPLHRSMTIGTKVGAYRSFVVGRRQSRQCLRMGFEISQPQIA